MPLFKRFLLAFNDGEDISSTMSANAAEPAACQIEAVDIFLVVTSAFRAVSDIHTGSLQL